MPGTGQDKADELSNKILYYSTDDKISCEKAFEIAKYFEVSPLTVGKNLNKLGVKITNCQLGLFGYEPEKKVLQPADDVSTSVENSINKHLTNNRIYCVDVWDVADENSISRMDAAAACETLSIKIKKCQLGAF